MCNTPAAVAVVAAVNLSRLRERARHPHAFLDGKEARPGAGVVVVVVVVVVAAADQEMGWRTVGGPGGEGEVGAVITRLE